MEAGYYHHGNVFAFYSDSATDTKLLQVRIRSKKTLGFLPIFYNFEQTAVLDNNSNMQEHVHVGFFAQTSDKQRLAFGTYDMFLARFEANSVWYAGESEFESLRAMFALRKMQVAKKWFFGSRNLGTIANHFNFQKFKLIGSALPYDIMVQVQGAFYWRVMMFKCGSSFFCFLNHLGYRPTTFPAKTQPGSSATTGASK